MLWLYVATVLTVGLAFIRYNEARKDEGLNDFGPTVKWQAVGTGAAIGGVICSFVPFTPETHTLIFIIGLVGSATAIVSYLAHAIAFGAAGAGSPS